MSARSDKMQHQLDQDAARTKAAVDAAAAARRADDTPPGTGGPTVNWRELDDVQARDVWIALRKFVEWVTVRYDIPVTVIPTCWWQHPAIVEEMAAVYALHQAAFDPKDSGSGPLTWHERFTAAQARITRTYGGACSEGHRRRKPRTWEAATDESEWDAWINQTHAH